MEMIIYWLFAGLPAKQFDVTGTAFMHTTEETLNMLREAQKATKKEIKEALMVLATDQTPNRFSVRFDSDGSGPCAVLMVERNRGEDSNGKSPFDGWKSTPPAYMGWRVVFVHVPHNYIDAFYDADGNYKITADT